MFWAHALSPWFACSRVRADRYGAHRERGCRLHDRADQAGLVVELAELRRGQLAQWLDGNGEPPVGAPLVPHPADHSVDEQGRVVSGLARRSERAGGGRAWVQPIPGLTRDEIRVEIGQQSDPAVRPGWRAGVAGDGPCRLAVQLDALQLA